MNKIFKKTTAAALSAVMAAVSIVATSNAETTDDSVYPSQAFSIRSEYYSKYPEDIELIDDVIEEIFNDKEFNSAF